MSKTKRSVLTFDDAYLSARARFETWREKFEAQFFGDVGEAMVMMMIANMTPEQKQQLAAMILEQSGVGGIQDAEG